MGKRLCNGLQSHFDREVAYVRKHTQFAFFSTTKNCGYSNFTDNTNRKTCCNTVKIKFPCLLGKPSSMILFMFHALHLNRQISLRGSGPLGGCLRKTEIGFNWTLSHWLLDGANWKAVRAPLLYLATSLDTVRLSDLPRGMLIWRNGVKKLRDSRLYLVCDVRWYCHLTPYTIILKL